MAKTPARMRDVHRIIPWDPKAAVGHPGHPTFWPRSNGSGRIDNPDLFNTLYLSGTPEGAIAETFQRHPVWAEHVFNRRDGRRWALVSFKLDDRRLLDLDAGATLEARSIKPSHVVSRDRMVTQSWAKRAFEEQQWSGLTWWSPLDSAWPIFGIWDHDSIKPASRPIVLHHDHRLVLAAAELVGRRL